MKRNTPTILGNKMTEYQTLKLPLSLLKKIDQYMEKEGGYTSRTDFIKEAIRLRLEELEEKKRYVPYQPPLSEGE